MEKEVIKVKAKMKLVLGKQENGEFLTFAEGEEKIVELNTTIKNFIDAGALEVVEGNEEDSKKLSEIEKFINIKYIGPELAQVLMERFKTYENFLKKASLEDLMALPGIGKERAEEIYKSLSRKKKI